MRDIRLNHFLVAALALAVPGIASARDAMSEARNLLTPAGEYFLVGGGVTKFADEALRDSFNLGGSWEARVGYGSRFYVGGELAYVGSTRGSDLFGLGSGLTSNGGEAVVRLQYPAMAGGWLVEPFAFGGIGWSHLKIRNFTSTNDSDNIGVIPFGAGVTGGYRGLLLDARFTYRPTFSDEDIVLSTNGTPGNLQSWAVMASVGYEF